MHDGDLADCACCPVPPSGRLCAVEGGVGPDTCPTRDGEQTERAFQGYGDPALRELARAASIQEGEGYCGRGPDVDVPRPCKPRLLETAELAERLGVTRLGLAFCSGLAAEARTVSEFLKDRGFQVVSVVCKAGRVPKERLGIRDGEKIRPGRQEAMCFPLLQAEVMNRAETGLNILLGLCVGHDSLFIKGSEAPCTVLAAKDRTSGHNPLSAVYNLNSYCRWLKNEAEGGY